MFSHVFSTLIHKQRIEKAFCGRSSDMCSYDIPRAMSNCVSCDGVFGVIFFKTTYNKTITRVGLGDIRKNQGLGNYYQPRPLARLITLASTLLLFRRILQKPCPIIVYYHYLLHCCYHYDYNNNNNYYYYYYYYY